MKDIVVAAYEFAERKHANYCRKGGNVPYIVHPVAVVETLMSWGIDDADVLAAAYLQCEGFPRCRKNRLRKRILCQN